MKRIRFEQGPEITLAVEPLSELPAADALPLHAQAVGHEALLGVENAVVVKPVCQVDAVIAGITVDLMLVDAAADLFDRVERELIELAAVIKPYRVDDASLAERKAAEHKAAIATGCAKTDAVRFEQHDIGL